MNSLKKTCLGIASLLAVFTAAAVDNATLEATLVVTDTGAVRGVASDGVISFKGIPYAAPPVGDLRWRVPQPLATWEGEHPAAEFGPSCMQADDVPKSEDCLTLNVWRPAETSETRLPVMVWIHGGVLVHGSTWRYPGDALARQGVLVVSMNYRMGRLGFFAHPALADESPDDLRGNYGFYDQQAALRWVQRNIAAFGGDPDRVTVFGESAGGGSIIAHLTSPLSHGLFHAAILQSPGVPNARATATPLTSLGAAEATAVAYARSVGIHGNGAEALAALRALPAKRLTAGASVGEVIDGLMTGRAVIGVANAILDGRFLAETPESALAAGRQAMVPLIVGANDADLGVGFAETKEALFSPFGTHADAARSLYDPAGTMPLAALRSQLLAEQTLIEPSRHLANEMARAGQTVWWYRFSYLNEALRDKLRGTLHAFEIPFVLNTPDALVGAKLVTDNDRAMGALVSAYWVDFAKGFDPNGGDRPRWPRHEPDLDRVIHFANEGVVVGPDPLKTRLDLRQTALQEER